MYEYNMQAREFNECILSPEKKSEINTDFFSLNLLKKLKSFYWLEICFQTFQKLIPFISYSTCRRKKKCHWNANIYTTLTANTERTWCTLSDQVMDPKL